MRTLLLTASLTLMACGSPQDSVSTLRTLDQASIFIDEENYTEQMANLVLPLWEEAEKGFFTGEDGTELFYAGLEHPDAKARIAIAHGFTENHLKYRELIYNFYNAGYSVYFYDQRGFGDSDRLVEGDPEIGWIKQWSDYTKDLRTFLTEVVPQDENPTLLFSHSMGGAVAADLLTQEPGIVKAAILSSPMLGINTGKYSRTVAVTIATGAVLIGKGQDYAPGEGPVNVDTWTLESSSTSSAPRFDRFKADCLSENIASGGASFNWVKEVLYMNIRLGKKGVASKASTPILMSQAGKDVRVNPGEQNKFCAAAPNCRLTVKLDSKHEIYNEVDAIREPWIEEMITFYDQYSL